MEVSARQKTAEESSRPLAILIALPAFLAAILAFGVAFGAPSTQKAYAASGTLAAEAVNVQAASASKTCALYTSKGTLVRCTSAGKQASGDWSSIQPFEVKTLYVASDVKTLKGTASYSYGAFTEEQDLSRIKITKLVFLTNSKGTNACTSIAAGAFELCESLKTISGLNKTKITSIGANAFDSNEALTSVSLPPTLKTIGKECFMGCSKLTTVSGLNKTKVTSMPEGVFAECHKLAGTIYLPSTCKKIGIYAFAGCKALKTVMFGKKLTSIGEYAFARCAKITSANLPASVKTINEGAFAGCASLKKATVRSTSIVKTNATAANMKDYGPFNDTAIAKAKQKAYIYVPKSLVSKYKTNSKWKAYKAKYRSITRVYELGDIGYCSRFGA